MNEIKHASFEVLRQVIRSNSTYLKLLNGIREFDDGWAILFQMLVDNYIMMIGSLPASENHHHAGSCGLLIHSIEVALFSLKIARRKVFINKPMNSYKKRQVENAYVMACTISGLFHDAGKVVYDVVVSTDSGAKWNPIFESLEEFVERHSAWTFTWRSNRQHKVHEIFTVLPLIKVTPDIVWEKLWAIDPNIQIEICKAIAGNDCQSLIHDVVIEADSVSVARNLSEKKTREITYVDADDFCVDINAKPYSEIPKSGSLETNLPDDIDAVVEQLKTQIRCGTGSFLEGSVTVEDGFYVTSSTCIDRICQLNPIFKKPFLLAILKGPQKHPVLKVVAQKIFLEKEND